MKKYVYIAGPYTNLDPVVNTRLAIEAGETIARSGYYSYIPHLSLFWHLIYPHEIEFWYKHDLAWLEKCDYIIRLPGSSSGADKEVEYAKSINIPVFYGLDDFFARH